MDHAHLLLHIKTIVCTVHLNLITPVIGNYDYPAFNTIEMMMICVLDKL